MAIEFDCPRCSATIRVPDAYSGRQGRCPQCNERLLVPLVAVPDVSQQQPAPLQPAFLHPAGTSAPSASVSTPVAGGVVEMMPAAAVASATAAQANPAVAAVLGAGQVPVSNAVPPVAVGSGFSGIPLAHAAPAARPSKTRSSRYNRRRPSRSLVIGIPVIGFLLLLAILALTIQTGPEMQGVIKGRILAEKSLPRTVVPWSDTGVSNDQQQLLQAALAENPETFSSELLVCRLLGTPTGLEIQLTAATGARWCAVNPHDAGQKALAVWLKQQRVRLGELRRTEMNQTLSAWCQDKVRQINGEQIAIDAAMARDNGVLNATVDSLGYSVQARAGKRLVRAAAEDDAGWIYFCVPGDTESLVVEGRSHGDSGLLFPGRYEVTLEAPAAVGTPAGPAEDSESDSGKSEEPAMEDDQKGMSDGDGESGGEGGTPQKDSFGETMKGMMKMEQAQ